MARRITSTDDPEWRVLFTGFTRSAFRLETLQHYSEPIEADAFAQFRAGHDPAIDMSWWLGMAIGHNEAGHRMSRVRIVVEPPSDYTRFEFALYPSMVATGDDIRVIPIAESEWPAGIPHEDFWLFDDRDLWVIEYDSIGTFLGADLIQNDHAVDRRRQWRDIAWSEAIPVNEYLANTASHPRAS
jgi:hypothetical protein